MSMPTFPEQCLDISEEQSLNMLLASIAMEELAFSHIINAEGEKLQYLFGTGACRPCQPTTVAEVLQANQSVTRLLDMVMQNQLLLKGKLQTVLDAKERLCPNPPCHKGQGCLQLSGPPQNLLCGDCLLFCQESQTSNTICWTKKSPCTIFLAGGHCYSLVLTVQYHCCAPRVCISVQNEDCTKAPILPPLVGGQHALTASFSLSAPAPCPLPVVLRLLSPQSLQLNCAQLCITVTD